MHIELVVIENYTQITHGSLHVSFVSPAQGMIRHDTVVELLQQRQEKDLKQLDKVSSFTESTLSSV